MQLVLLTLTIGLLNLGLGYAIAVYLGYGPPTLRATWGVLRTWPQSAEVAARRLQAAEEVLVAAGEPPDVALAASSAPDAQEKEQEEEQREQKRPEDQQQPDSEETPELTGIEALWHAVNDASSNLKDLATRLEKNRAVRYTRTPWSLVGELQETCGLYLQRLSKAAEPLLEGAGEPDEAPALSELTQQILLEQVAQLETTLNNLQYMDFESGTLGAMARLATETHKTLAVARRLREALAVDRDRTDAPDAEPSGEAAGRTVETCEP